MKNLLYLLFFLLFPLFSFGQDNSTAGKLIQQANEALEAEQFKQSNKLFINATKIYAEERNWDAYFDCGVNVVSNLIQLGNYEEGVSTANTYIDKAKSVNYEGLPLSLLHKKIGIIHYTLDDYKQALPALEQALLVRENIDPDDPELARDYGNLGIIGGLSGRYNRATEYLEKALTLQDDDNVLARLYIEMGNNYKDVGNFRKSLDFQNQAIRILESNDSRDDAALAHALLVKGLTLTELKQEGEDLVCLQKALELFKGPAFDYTNQVNCYRNIAYSYQRFNKSSKTPLIYLDSAQFYYEKALKIAVDHLPEKNNYSTQILFDLSSVLIEKKQFEEAEQFLNKGTALSATAFEAKSIQNSKSLEITALFHRSKGDFEAALKYHQKQLISVLVGDYNDLDIQHLPSLEQSKANLSNDAITDALALKARTWYLYYKYGKADKNKLLAALETIRLFDDMVNHIRADFSNSGSNIAWSDLTLDAYENGIEICLALAKETNDPMYKELALFYSEKSKGLNLLESFQATKAKQVAGLSEADLIKERELKLDIADLKQEVFQLTQQRNPKLAEDIKKLKKRIFIKEKTYQDFLKELEHNHPQYYNTKYNLEILNLTQMRELLKEDQGFVEYFIGDSSVFAFKITKTEFEIFTLDIQENMMSSVGNFRKSIYGYFLSSKERSEQIKSKYASQYVDQAYKLYQNLIEPLGKLPRRLIIIPAGAMCDMPFEPLLTKKVTYPENYKSHPYLVQDHLISYCYSATLLKEMMNKKHLPTDYTYVGFAPSFGESAVSVIRGKRFALSPLAFNKPEVENINALLGEGTIFADEAATENQFKAIASDYKIIHFATHGMANSNDPDYSLLAFTEVEDDKENEFLYVSDLYNLELNAEMVVLSACETALGKNFRGEGIMSLARGFSYAGTKSIFTTLWSVNDQSTYNIIRSYYIYLQQGMEKDEALHHAKLDYIKNANDFAAHPFLWSPYILIGDTDDVPALQKSNIWIWIAGGVAIVLLLAGLVFFLDRKKEVV
jgi:CHAT domain-containing protein/tetratricopeptide (TPR) repeat protein